jgi:hypothetical protein
MPFIGLSSVTYHDGTISIFNALQRLFPQNAVSYAFFFFSSLRQYQCRYTDAATAEKT